MVWYEYYDFVNLFSTMNYNNPCISMGIVLNFVSILGTIIVIQFLPNKRVPIVSKFNHSFRFYLICLLVFYLNLYFSGGYDSVLNDSLHGALFNYISLFFDATTGLTLFIFLQNKIKYEGISILAYVVLFTFAGSRSAIIIILVIFLVLKIFENYNQVKKKMQVLILVFCFISPAAFYYASGVRGFIDTSFLFDLIIGRVSMVELAAIPIEAKEEKYLDYTLYNNKYGIVNQFKQSFNEISPIDPFEHDKNPNQYHRAIFLGNSEKSVLENYMSMNMSLPTYFYISSNMFFGCIFTIFFLSLLYYIWIIKSDNLYFLIGIIMSLYYILQYFDWVMLLSGLFRIVLTIFTLKQFERIFNILKDSNKMELDETVAKLD